MDPTYRVGQKVNVDIGGCPENRTEGVIVAVKLAPALTTYEVTFPSVATDGRVATFYMAHDLIPV